MTYSDLLVFATGLLALINPPSVLPAYIELVSGFSASTQRQIALRTGLAIAVVTLLVVWLGRYMLDWLDVQIGALQVAGGIILIRGAMRMVDATNRRLKADELEQTEQETWQVMSVVPLAVPLSVGGGVMAYLVATTARFNTLADLMLISGACLFSALVVAAIYFFSAPISHWLGAIGMRILVRIGGIVLMAIAIQLIAAGLIDLLPALGSLASEKYSAL